MLSPPSLVAPANLTSLGKPRRPDVKCPPLRFALTWPSRLFEPVERQNGIRNQARCSHCYQAYCALRRSKDDKKGATHDETLASWYRTGCFLFACSASGGEGSDRPCCRSGGVRSPGPRKSVQQEVRLHDLERLAQAR